MEPTVAAAGCESASGRRTLVSRADEFEATDEKSQFRPRLITTRAPRRPSGIVVVLHGGGGSGLVPVRPTQPSVLRLIPVAGRIAQAGHGRLAVVRLLNAVRGWRSGVSPVADVEWALGEARDRFGPDLPISLVGHSLGGSVALRAAGAHQVRSVVALSPWLRGDEPATQFAGRRVLILHGTADRITSPATSAGYAGKVARTAETVSYVKLVGGSHALLRHLRLVDGLAAQFALASLLGPDQLARGEAGDIARRALSGESPIELG
ncbi:MAG: alpha/beta hydrolase [Pseudonocardiales bacterium]|nr:alpha/beta hydrolase [Pseudonocardiales bacterium]